MWLSGDCIFRRLRQSQSKISRCQPRTWLNGGWVRAAGAGGLMPGRRHISVRLSCSGSLLKFQCQDSAWLTNKGRLCVWGQGDRQASEPVKWQEMARGPVTPLQEQTQHYLTVRLQRCVGSLLWASMYTEIAAVVRTQQSAHSSFFLSNCLHVWAHLCSRKKNVRMCAGTVRVMCQSVRVQHAKMDTYYLIPVISLPPPFVHLMSWPWMWTCVSSIPHLLLSSLYLSIC